MNTNLKIKDIIAKTLFAIAITIIPSHSINAQKSSDDFGIWGTVEFSKKVNKKSKFVIDAEVRSIEAVSDFERIAVGAKLDYEIKQWKNPEKLVSKAELKSNLGYCFIYGHYLSEKNLKEYVEEVGEYNYNIDEAYWAARNRVYLTLTGEMNIGRFEISLRERLQYTHTGSVTIDETKYRWEKQGGIKGEWTPTTEIEPELKEVKENLSLRSRLSIKYDIPNCKINPFISAELYTRLDKWQAFDKARYRAGASYKINKKNDISLFYLYEDVNGNDPDCHAVGFEYSIDL
jgi:hypothetical protein